MFENGPCQLFVESSEESRKRQQDAVFLEENRRLSGLPRFCEPSGRAIQEPSTSLLEVGGRRGGSLS